MSCAFRFCRCVGSLQGLWYGWVTCASRSRRRLSSNASSSRCQRSITSLLSTRRHICVFVPHTGVRNSRNRFRMSSTGEELSKNTDDDPRGARAVSKLGVVGLERDSSSSPPLAQQVLHQHCEPLQPSCKLNILTAKGRSHAGDAEVRASRKVFRTDSTVQAAASHPTHVRPHRTHTALLQADAAFASAPR